MSLSRMPRLLNISTATMPPVVTRYVPKAELFLAGTWYHGVADSLSNTAHELLSGRRLQIVTSEDLRLRFAV